MHSKFAACCLQLLLGSWLFRVVHDTEYGSVFTFQNSGGFWLLFKVSIRFNQRFASQERFLIEVSKIQNDSSKGIITQELPRAFQSPLCPWKIILLTFSMLFIFSSHYWLGSFWIFCYIYVSLFFLVSFLPASHLCFVYLASIVAESCCYCQSCERKSVCWLVSDIDLHPVLGGDGVTGGVMINDHYYRSCCQRSWNIQTCLLSMQLLHYFCVFLFWSPLFPICWNTDGSGSSQI